MRTIIETEQSAIELAENIAKEIIARFLRWASTKEEDEKLEELLENPFKDITFADEDLEVIAKSELTKVLAIAKRQLFNKRLDFSMIERQS